jgi:hypothetical protein
VNDYLEFLKKRREKCSRTHWLWRTLPPAIIPQIEAYLPKSEDIHEVICKEQMFTIHSDMTDENMIGLEVENKTKKGKAKKYVITI